MLHANQAGLRAKVGERNSIGKARWLEKVTSSTISLSFACLNVGEAL
ncbi:hypothetical protein Krac_4255 [Ktedonobacter racemifer DSM 44963]|uniref:Uncharacterized protein n=1 Tax=Ktedonobacter racemifer DSM 44963 TaxID=485913 RepID=D6TSA6_KTERA|nr:hypothetical protein Krac_4255 [Ktedonobacter racemifer DSM 44963]